MNKQLEEDSKYAILNTSFVNKDKIKSQYPKMKQVELFSQYSSDLAEKIRKSELKELIKNSGLLNEKE